MTTQKVINTNLGEKSYASALDNCFINYIPLVDQAFVDAKKHIDEVCMKLIKEIEPKPKEKDPIME